jgi:hypothetical protein
VTNATGEIGPTVAVGGDAQGNETELRLIVTVKLFSAW